MRFRRSVVVGGSAIVAMALGAAPASAAIHCGDTITNDTTLGHDLHCGPGESGLVIGANGVELDLNGHTISGPDSLTEAVFSPGHNRVKVVDGKIRGFDLGVDVGDAENVTISHLDIKGTAINSIRLSQVVDAKVSDNVLSKPVGDNILVYGDSHEVKIAGNELHRGGVTLNGGSGYTVTGNEIIKTNGVGIGAQAGIDFAGAADVLIGDNHIEDAAGSAIAAATADGVRVDRNTVRGGASSGISITSSSTGVKVLRNDVSGSEGNGIFVGSGTDAALRANLVKKSAGDGILVDDADTLIEKNTANRNDDNGIDSASSNGSDNVAKHNGLHPQCVPSSLCA